MGIFPQEDAQFPAGVESEDKIGLWEAFQFNSRLFLLCRDRIQQAKAIVVWVFLINFSWGLGFLGQISLITRQFYGNSKNQYYL